MNNLFKIKKNKSGYTLTPKFGVTRKRGGHAPTSMLGVARKGGGYTLIEILIVISIIGFIVSAAMYLVTSAREEARIAGLLQFSDGIRASLSDSPVSYWSFDGGDATDSWGQNHGTVNGANCTVAGIVGSACYFDGSNDSVGLPDNSVFTSVGDFTVEAWINPEDPSGIPYRTIIGFGAGGDEFLFGLNNGKLVLYASLPGGEKIGNTVLSSGIWQHVVFSRNGADYVFYLNGKRDGEGTWSSAIININGATRAIGRDKPSTGTEIYKGIIDEVKIYSEGLSFAQVQKLYAEGAKKFQIAVK